MSDPSTATLIRLRTKMRELLKGLSHEEAMTVPPGHRTSILWNIGHALVTQQLLTYLRSGLKPRIELDLMDHYAKGTDGSGARAADIPVIEESLLRTAFVLQDDVAAGRFSTYEGVHTSLDVHVGTIQEALAFNNVHEGLHLGYARAQARDVRVLATS